MAQTRSPLPSPIVAWLESKCSPRKMSWYVPRVFYLVLVCLWSTTPQKSALVILTRWLPLSRVLFTSQIESFPFLHTNPRQQEITPAISYTSPGNAIRDELIPKEFQDTHEYAEK